MRTLGASSDGKPCSNWTKPQKAVLLHIARALEVGLQAQWDAGSASLQFLLALPISETLFSGWFPPAASEPICSLIHIQQDRERKKNSLPYPWNESPFLHSDWTNKGHIIRPGPIATRPPAPVHSKSRQCHNPGWPRLIRKHCRAQLPSVTRAAWRRSGHGDNIGVLLERRMEDWVLSKHLRWEATRKGELEPHCR